MAIESPVLLSTDSIDTKPDGPISFLVTFSSRQHLEKISRVSKEGPDLALQLMKDVLMSQFNCFMPQGGSIIVTFHKPSS